MAALRTLLRRDLDLLALLNWVGSSRG